MQQGNFGGYVNAQGSLIPIYDPTTGTVDGKNRSPFPGNIIPSSRIDPVVKKIIPNIPATNQPGVVNNYYVNRAVLYNLHKIDTKFDYNPADKLRLSFVFSFLRGLE